MNAQKNENPTLQSKKKQAVAAITTAFKLSLKETGINIRELSWFSNKDLSANHPLNFQP